MERSGDREAAGVWTNDQGWIAVRIGAASASLLVRPTTVLWLIANRQPAQVIGLAAFIFLAQQPLLSLISERTLAAGFASFLILLAVALRHHPVAVALAVIAASTIMRVAFIGVGQADQIAVTQPAWERVLDGASPYGVGYTTAISEGAPYAYGPLGLLWWLPGRVVEFAAATVLMALLAWQRAWLTLAVVGGWLPMLYLPATGVNDFSPALFVALAVLLLRSHPIWAGTTIAVAAALKPYAAAWFLPFVGVGGIGTAAAIAGVSLVLWSPLLLWWGIPSFLRTIELAYAVHPISEHSFNLPVFRWLAVPIAAIGLLARRWEYAALIGAAAFITFLFLDRWASYGYWVTVLPPLGLALETGLMRSALVRARSWRGSWLRVAEKDGRVVVPVVNRG